MKKNLVIALIALLLIFGGGYVAFTFLFADEPKDGAEVAGEIFDAAPAIEVSDAEAAEPNQIRAAVIEGRVERRDKGGEWVPVAKDDVLAMTDEVRTGPDAHAEFSIGDSTSVEVAQETSLVFIEISDAVSKIRLSDGRVAASSEGRKVRIEVKNSDAVAETSDGAFAVLTEGEGNVTVASSRGSVALSAKGETVNVEAGTQSLVSPNSAPSAPMEIPNSLFLKVRRPHADARLESAMVAGTATPGTIINIGDAQIPVGSDGRFETRVGLGVGSRDIRVTVVDASGRKETQAVRVITPKANTKGQVEW